MPSGRLIRECVETLTAAARGLPASDRVAPRHVREGTLDLTGARLFAEDVHLHAQIVGFATSVDFLLSGPFGPLKFSVALTLLFSSLHGLHSLWKKKQTFTSADLVAYRGYATRFGQIWKALGWKVSTWVHWAVCHSPILADLHKNFYLFSSIPPIPLFRNISALVRSLVVPLSSWKPYGTYVTFPANATQGLLLFLKRGMNPTERRNSEFKLDVSHCFQGWKLTRPSASRHGFGLVLNLAALDAGILLHDAKQHCLKRSREAGSDSD